MFKKIAMTLAAGFLAAPALAGGSTLTTELMASNIDKPTGVVYSPDNYTWVYVLQKNGLVRQLNIKTGSLSAQVFLNLTSKVNTSNSQGDERGLLGMAFHPDYEDNGYIYVHYTAAGGATKIERYERTGNNMNIDIGTATPVLTTSQPFSNHNGGSIHFGPNDGYLYIGLGDGGSGGDPQNNGQDISTLLGKILRIDIDADDFPADPNANYANPSDNPFVGVAGRDEIWAYGIRNPWQMDFDRETGDFYIADVGQNVWEEINIQPADSPGGENYGWRVLEGNSCFDNSQFEGNPPCSDGSLTSPVHVYSHGLGCSISGGGVYRGCDIEGLDGAYFFADYCSSRIWSFKYVGGSVTEFQERTAELDPPGGGDAGAISSIAGMGEDAWGELYIFESNSSGEIHKIVPTVQTRNPYDLDCDGAVDVNDLLTVLAEWGSAFGSIADVDGNGFVTIDEILGVLANWS